VFLQAAFDELWDECSGRYAGLGNAHRDFARERLACCLALISTGLTVDSDEQASGSLEEYVNLRVLGSV